MIRLLLAIILCVFFIGCDSGSNDSTVNIQSDIKPQTDSDSDAEKYRELVNLYVGKTVPYSQYELIGKPETLLGTNNSQWVAYFPKGNFTIVTNKKTDVVRTVYVGKHEF